MPNVESKSSAGVTRVSTLELFFDLVFVFAITQVSHLFGDAQRPLEFLRAFLVLAVVWWMYGGYAWLTSNVGTDRFTVRLLLLCAMGAFLVIALRIPAVASRHGLAFGLAYLVVVLIHTALFTHAPNSSARAILGVLPFNLLLAIAVLASGVVSADWNWIPWVLAGTGIAVMTAARIERDFQVSPSHFVERHGLVILIALGESVVAIGVSAETMPMDLQLVAWVTVGLALAGALWWSYFDQDDVRAEHAMAHATGAARARLALSAYYHAHLLMIAGIVMMAAGVHEATGSDASVRAVAWLVSGGVALYLVGGAVYRWLLDIGPVWPRLVAALAALGVASVAMGQGTVRQRSLIVAVLVPMLIFERKRVPVPAAERDPAPSQPPR